MSDSEREEAHPASSRSPQKPSHKGAHCCGDGHQRNSQPDLEGFDHIDRANEMDAEDEIPQGLGQSGWQPEGPRGDESHRGAGQTSTPTSRLHCTNDPPGRPLEEAGAGAAGNPSEDAACSIRPSKLARWVDRQWSASAGVIWLRQMGLPTDRLPQAVSFRAPRNR